jgi:hypothetical protein
MRKRISPVAAATAIGAEAQTDAVNISDSCTKRQGPAVQPGSDGPFSSAAEIFRHAGLRIIPLTGEGDGKPPPVNRFTSWKGRPSLATLARWSERWPGCNVGIVTGHRVTVIDIDDAGLIDEMIRRFGATPLQVATPSGGIHLYYASSGERCGTLRPSLPVDIKGLGGYVVAPPSIRPRGEFAGRQYEIVRGSWEDLSTLPPLRSGSLPGLTSEPGEPPTPLRAVRTGRRNKTLFQRLLRHAPHCDDPDALIDVARTIAADHFVDDPLDPFDDAEIEKTARSAWKYETEGRNWAGRAGRIHVTADEIAAFAEHPNGANMALLLLILRRAHWSRPVFAASPKAMAEKGVIPGWGRSPDRYRCALASLVDVRMLRIEKQGGSKRGDAKLYSFNLATGGRGGGGCLSYIGS